MLFKIEGNARTLFLTFEINMHLFSSKVVCGYAHTLALSDSGELYGWGANSYGQLGSGNKANSCTPTRVAEAVGRVVDVSASHYNHISAALTQDSKVYMWG